MAESFAWTADDIRCLKAAIMKKAEGKRLTAVDLGGRLEQYADAPLDQLKALLEDMIGVVSPTHRRMIFRSSYSKGL